MTQDLPGQRVVVMGLGRFGGGLGVTRWLLGQGARVTLTDLLGEEELAEQLAPLGEDIGAGRVRLRLGAHDESDFRSADLVVASPAVPKPWRNPFLRAAEQAGVPVTTEIGLLYERIPDHVRVVGVTGSAGKSTTSAMIAAGARAALGDPGGPRVLYGGNIGGSLLGDLPRMGDAAAVVLELSSAMLWWLEQSVWGRTPAERRERRPRRGVDVAVVTNFSPNHLDWHASLEHYAESKRALLRHQPMESVAVFGPDLPAAGATPTGVGRWEARESVREIRVHPDDAAALRGILLPGAHNRTNAAVAFAACRALRSSLAGAFDLDAAAGAISAFPGLPHRLQFVAEIGAGDGRPGIRFYNDSKSTVPEAAILAVDALEAAGAGRIHLIAGGYDKGLDLSPLIERLRALPARLYTVGATGDVLAGMARLARIETAPCGTVEAAVRAAADHARPGEAVLLSPGCASWDQFPNYERRGEAFIEAVRSLPGASR